MIEVVTEIEIETEEEWNVIIVMKLDTLQSTVLEVNNQEEEENIIILIEIEIDRMGNVLNVEVVDIK